MTLVILLIVTFAFRTRAKIRPKAEPAEVAIV
jgi:hypothetical protein